MKKVIVAAAGLMLAGVMTSTALSFSGDARARFRYFDEYQSNSSKDSHFDSRARLAIAGETKGGAYAKARFTFADGRWDGTRRTRNWGNIRADYAYIGVPMGPVTVEAGLYNNRTISEFTIFEENVDTLQAVYKADQTTITGFMDLVQEDTSVSNNDDVMAWGLVLNQGFSCGANLIAGAMYQYNPNTGGPEGLLVGIDASGNFGGITLSGGVAYREADLQATQDDGYGLWAKVETEIGAANVGLIAGATFEGYTPDWGDFDVFYVLGDVYMISNGDMIGSGGDAYWASLQGSYKASEKLILGARIGYADMDYATDDSAFEIGARAVYQIIEGASLQAMLGYANYDKGSDPLGFGLELKVTF